MIILMVSMWDVGAMTVNALQSIWNEWNTSTPHSNLEGWESNGKVPCYTETWQGLQCQEQRQSKSSNDWNVYIIGL